jgi:acetoin utilization protein AcuC
MSGKTALIYSDRFLEYNFGPHHPLRPVRVKLACDLLRSKGLLENSSVEVVGPRPASRDEILLFQDEAYVTLVEKYSEKGSGLLDMGDTPAFKGCYEATSLVVGASLKACDLIMSGKFAHAFNPSGGLHHAHPDRASGFCIFNDPAISINYLKSKHAIKRLLYMDIDAHHGDGVMYGFYQDPSVLDIDFHESGRFLFPGTGFPDEIGEGEARGLKINIPFLPETGDQAYLKAFHQITPGLVRKFRPEIILVQGGADGHFDDRLAHLRLSTNFYREVIGEMHRLAHELCNGRFLLFGGGGYTLQNVTRVWAMAFTALAGLDANDEIPKKWAEEFHHLTGQDPPERFHDPPTEDLAKTVRETERVLEELLTYLSKSNS